MTIAMKNYYRSFACASLAFLGACTSQIENARFHKLTDEFLKDSASQLVCVDDIGVVRAQGFSVARHMGLTRIWDEGQSIREMPTDPYLTQKANEIKEIADKLASSEPSRYACTYVSFNASRS
jgi:hypothetical protein